ncbi:MAG: LD-carboxypeptidase [Endozoicomonadaceae bacterium]|nr:LD-carboxypeptidase [Endozoicomonadaceae bacterium]
MQKKYHINLHIAPHVLQQHHYFAGTVEQRRADLQAALDNATLDYIWCASGGYGLIHIIDQLNFDNFKKNKSRIIGCSDITILHAKMQQLKQSSLHGTMPSMLANNTLKSTTSLYQAMLKETLEYTFPAIPYNRFGQTTAPVIGGNLSIITSLMGTPLEMKIQDHILFIEDINESIHKIDRIDDAIKIIRLFKTD